MKARIPFHHLFWITTSTLIGTSCGDPVAATVHEVALNEDVKERFERGDAPGSNLYQYGRGSENALDILVPIDPNSEIQSIAKAHVHYVSRGSTVKFNFETLADLTLYEYDDDLEDKGEVYAPKQLISMCTFAHPITGVALKKTDGDPVDIEDKIDEITDTYRAQLRQCSTGTTGFGSYQLGKPLDGSCQVYEFGTSDDPFAGQTFRTTELKDLCRLGADFSVDGYSGFWYEVLVSSYNDDQPRFEDKLFSIPISPHIFTVDENETTIFRVTMTPDEDNDNVVAGTAGNERFLRYEWRMPEDDDGIWQANFASDIRIEYIRFFWADSNQGAYVPIVQDPMLGSPPHVIQVNQGRTCNNVDAQGFFGASGCGLITNNTPATSKTALNSSLTWRMSILWDSYNYDIVSGWNQPVVMEFGLRADP